MKEMITKLIDEELNCAAAGGLNSGIHSNDVTWEWALEMHKKECEAEKAKANEG